MSDMKPANQEGRPNPGAEGRPAGGPPGPEQIAGMKKAGIMIALCMGVVMSFFLSLIGTLTSGHFTVPGFLLSFVVSTVISFIIGLIVPMGRIHQSLHRKIPNKIGALLVTTLISDLIYTPFMTLTMVSLAYAGIMRQSGGMAQVPFIPMFLRALVISMVAGYILIAVVQPLIFGFFMKKAAGPK